MVLSEATKFMLSKIYSFKIDCAFPQCQRYTAIQLISLNGFPPGTLIFTGFSRLVICGLAQCLCVMASAGKAPVFTHAASQKALAVQLLCIPSKTKRPSMGHASPLSVSEQTKWFSSSFQSLWCYPLHWMLQIESDPAVECTTKHHRFWVRRVHHNHPTEFIIRVNS